MTGRIDPIAEFREDHRKVRDAVLTISEALRDKDVKKAREVLGVLNELTGPHFRYEEENLYPALRKYLGEYVDSLYKEHDSVIKTAKVCASLLAKDTLTDKESEHATNAAMQMLIHVSNCDGLAILSERFNSGEMDELAKSFGKARQAGVTLLEWADTIRKQQKKAV
jgi:hemerythrin